MSKSTAKPVALAVAGVIGGLALSGAAFSMAPLAGGYMVGAQDAAQDAADAVPAREQRAHGDHDMARVDSDGDGRISAAEFSAAHAEKDPSYFTSMDSNGDGFVDKAEHDAHHATKKATSGDKAAQEGKCGEGKCGGSGSCGGAA